MRYTTTGSPEPTFDHAHKGNQNCIADHLDGKRQNAL
jgi:hypothetical protein